MKNYYELYSDTLSNKVMPFWLKNAIGESAALPVKDPFHLPRALIYLIELFKN